jgi:hopene-associated glycosyltransferase HpnB
MLFLMLLALVIWLSLILFWGRFWLCDQRLPIPNPQGNAAPFVCVILPARNEADILPHTLPTLLEQDYGGELAIVVVDDQSTDGTGELCQTLGQKAFRSPTILRGEPLPAGWSGKIWAMEQGIRWLGRQQRQPDYYLFTDADIAHAPDNIQNLVAKAETENIGLVSLMVLLHCQSGWERLLIPAFVFFFQLLYPFPWVNNPRHPWAGAAGGCILLRRQALERIGGLASLRQALIDDCTLAQKVKGAHYSLWLGLTDKTLSLRAYDQLAGIWDMVARTAYSQLNYNPLLLLGTVLGMILVYALPPLGLLLGLMGGQPLVAIVGGLGWGLMAIAYGPTLKLYQQSLWWGLTLPWAAVLYTLMTLDSARRQWQGRGGAWKGRVYSSNSGHGNDSPPII